MENGLFPVFDVPEVVEDEVNTAKQYPNSPLFDIETGEFVLNGSNQIVHGSGYDAWKLWCIKTVLTQRFSHLAYSSNVGIEAEEAFKEIDRDAQESAFERTITEALLADPLGRTVQVQGFEFEWGADSLKMSCEVTGVEGNTAAITAILN